MSQWSGASGEPTTPPLEQVDAGLEQLSLLAGESLEREAYYQQWLTQAVPLAAARGGAVWNARQLRFEPLAQWPSELEQWGSSPQFRRQHAARLQEVARHGQATEFALPPATGAASGAPQPTHFLLPIKVEGQTVAVAQWWYDSVGSSSEHQHQVRQAAGEMAADFESHWDRRSWSQQALFWRHLAELAASLTAATSTEFTEQTIVSQARTLIPCTRACLVRVAADHTARVAAVSDTPWIERRSARVRSLEALARIIASGRQPLWHGDGLPAVPDELQDLFQNCLEQSNARFMGAIALITTASEQESEPAVVAVLIVEAQESEHRGDRISRAEQLAAICADPLSAAYEFHGLPLLAVSRWLRDLFIAPLRSRWARLAALLLALVLVPAALLWIPADLEIQASGQLLPAQRQHIYAPLDGVIARVDIKHGQPVRPGTELFLMQSASLEQELTRLRGELDSTQQQIRSLNSARSLNEAEAGNEQRADLFRISAELAQLEAVVISYQQQIQLATTQQEELTVRSPVAGEVLTWQVADQLLARPVDRGQKLVTIADTRGPWEIAFEVPAEEIGLLREASAQQNRPLEVRFVLETDPGREYRGTVERIGQAVQRTDADRLIVPVIVTIDSSILAEPRAGTGIRGRVACGRRSLGFVWFRQIIRYFQLNWL